MSDIDESIEEHEDDRKVSGGEMIRNYLETNGYDGLMEQDGECGCDLDNLMPCSSESITHCLAGHKVDGCTELCGEGCKYHIIAGKRSENND